MKHAVKKIGEAISLLLLLPAALCTGFGRFPALYAFFAQAVALLPGLPGDYARAAYYRWTLGSFGRGSRVQFGSFFAHADAKVGERVYIGTYSVLGRVEIGDCCQIASGVQILSGSGQHRRKPDGSIGASDVTLFRTVYIGKGTWIGAGVIVMADVGANCIVGAGSVVTRSLPDGCTAVGVPAKALDSK